MKRNVFFVVLFLMTTSVFSQEKTASEILKQYGFTSENVLSCIDLSNSKYSFKSDVTEHTYSTSNNTDAVKHRKYSFNWKNKEGEKYKLLSVEGKEPTKKQIKRFLKSKNVTNNGETLKLTDDNFFVQSNNDKTVIIAFNVDKEKLPAKSAFMAHCTGYITINKETKRITKIEIKSNEAFNMKVFHVISMDVIIDISFNEDTKQYYVNKESSKTSVIILGAVTNIDVDEVYSDFDFN